MPRVLRTAAVCGGDAGAAFGLYGFRMIGLIGFLAILALVFSIFGQSAPPSGGGRRS